MTTKRIEGVVRDVNTGIGQGSVTVTIKKVSDGSTVTSTTTDNAADIGYYSRLHDVIGYPGPVYEEVTYSSTTKRRDGRVHGQLAGLLWADDVNDVLALIGIGVTTGLAVTASGVSMAPAVSAGSALLKDGLPYILETASSVTLAAADATNPRIDRIVVRLTREGQTDQGKIVLAAITGTPAASPVAPALTQTSATWDLSLAQVLVGAGVTTIAADKVTDERTSNYLANVTSDIQAQLGAKQPLDTDLTAIAALTSAANKIPYSSGPGAWSLADFPTAVRTLFTTPSSANLAALLTDETGSGANVFAVSPTITGTGSITASTVSSNTVAATSAATGLTVTHSATVGTDLADTFTVNATSALAALNVGGMFNLPSFLVFGVNTTSVDFTNTDTANNADAVTVDLTLPTGTWTVYAIGGGAFQHSAAGMTTRINLVIDGTVGANADLGTLGASTAKLSVNGSTSKTGVASGTRTVKVTFRSTTAGTITCDTSWVAAFAIRTA